MKLLYDVKHYLQNLHKGKLFKGCMFKFVKLTLCFNIIFCRTLIMYELGEKLAL